MKVRALMKICLVSAFPPSKGGLNEYGYHIAKELQQNPLHSLTILADELESPCPELPGFEVVRCWSFNKLSNPMRLWKAIRDIKPDVVWFKLLFSTFGNNPIAAFTGLMVPALMRLSGYDTHVTWMVRPWYSSAAGARIVNQIAGFGENGNTAPTCAEFRRARLFFMRLAPCGRHGRKSILLNITMEWRTIELGESASETTGVIARRRGRPGSGRAPSGSTAIGTRR